MLQFNSNIINNTLVSSSEEWFSFQKEYLDTHSRIDISQLSIEDIDFSSYEFRNCNFLGIVFSEANFDNSRFYNCLFSGCKIEFSSFVGTVFNDVILENVTITDCTFRQSTFGFITLDKCSAQNNTLKNSSVNRINFEETDSKNSKLTDVDLIETNMRNCTVNELKGTNLRLRSAKLFNTCLTQGEFTDAFVYDMEISTSRVENTILTKLHINDSDIKDTIIQTPSYNCCSFSNCKLVNQDLISMGINVNSFFQSAFLDCKWPSQIYKVGILGKYTAPVNLLKQPVEDITGVSPKLRKEIQKAQLVDETQRNASTWYSKLWLWFWGITTEYGRSLLRLTNICFAMMFIIIILFIVFISKDSFSISQMPQYLYDAIPIVFFNFIGITVDNSIMVLTTEQNALLIIDRILGVVFMGLWIGIATNKIGTID